MTTERIRDYKGLEKAKHNIREKEKQGFRQVWVKDENNIRCLKLTWVKT